ncbi:MAG: ribonucleoside-diphosphate reductase, partial [Methylovulum sp.]|nr:ribonucleoside-diphosphate reductase [Methylovulum sp.]
MSAQLHVIPQSVTEIPFQDASMDIWDTKYCLKTKEGVTLDTTIDGTYQRVAKALSEVEQGKAKQEQHYKEFLWALRQGAIPAGRIVSNAGALEHKPATSTINCTVSGIIADSMDDILHKVHEAGLTLKAGCGIGYEFSTLRPKGAYVSGAGAYTSGPLSFMDIYDKMCFTVSSAGGRRGAQMATFDVGHPDVIEFIRAKREDGRLRQFNLSLLITAEFMQAVKNDQPWALSFPVTEKEVQADKLDLSNREQIIWRDFPNKSNYLVNNDGLVACRVTKTMPARRLWDMIMSSTYDYAEPGFILIDKVNEMNNNWFCEKIRATNPCVTADTRLHTQYGLVKIGDLYHSGAALQVTVDKRALGQNQLGTEVRPAKPAFMTARSADVYRVRTRDGYEIKATAWHDFYTARGKIKLKDLQVGDQLLIQSGKGQFGKAGDKNFGILLGLMTGDGHFTNRGKEQQAAVINLWNDDRSLAPMLVAYINQLIATTALEQQRQRTYQVSPVAVPQRNLVMIRSVRLARLLEFYGFNKASKLRVPEVVWQGNEECVKGYLSGLFQADG